MTMAATTNGHHYETSRHHQIHAPMPSGIFESRTPSSECHLQPPPPKRVPVKSAFHSFTTPFQFKEPEETPSFSGRAPGEGNIGLFGVNKQAYRPGMSAVRRVGNGDASPPQDPIAAGADPSLTVTSGIGAAMRPNLPQKLAPMRKLGGRAGIDYKKRRRLLRPQLRLHPRPHPPEEPHSHLRFPTRFCLLRQTRWLPRRQRQPHRHLPCPTR